MAPRAFPRDAPPPGSPGRFDLLLQGPWRCVFADELLGECRVDLARVELKRAPVELQGLDLLAELQMAVGE
jgi:hypothetical protein